MQTPLAALSTLPTGLALDRRSGDWPYRIAAAAAALLVLLTAAL